MQTCGRSGSFARCGCANLWEVILLAKAQELSSGSRAISRRLCSDIFQGKKGSMSEGTQPPFWAQLSRNGVSQVRMLSRAIVNVANRENSSTASRPLHNAHDP